MLRLGKSLGCAVLAAAWLMMPTAQAVRRRAQAPTPHGNVMPQAPTSSQPVSAGGASAFAQRPLRHKKASRSGSALNAAPPPPTLEQSTPTPPRVSFQNGQLTIDATNSTLSQVLRAVQSRTGASIDIPAGAGNERVVAQLGPGQPRDVLNTLLNGSKFDYVILGVTGNPGAVQKVILTPRQGGATITAQSNTPRQPVQDDESQVDESPPVADTAENEYQNPDQPPPPPGGFRHPMMPPGGRSIPVRSLEMAIKTDRRLPSS
jgi:hypothetical protein